MASVWLADGKVLAPWLQYLRFSCGHGRHGRDEARMESPRERTASKRYPRPVPGRRFLGQSHKPFRTPLRISFRTRTPRSDTQAAPPIKQRKLHEVEECPNLQNSKYTKTHVRGLSFSRAPKHECMHLCCMHRIRHQSIPCPPIHAPLRQLSGSQIHAASNSKVISKDFDLLL